MLLEPSMTSLKKSSVGAAARVAAGALSETLLAAMTATATATKNRDPTRDMDQTSSRVGEDPQCPRNGCCSGDESTGVTRAGAMARVHKTLPLPT